jgi:hypothetical protein
LVYGVAGLLDTLAWISQACARRLTISARAYPYCTLQRGGKDEGEGLEPKSTAYLVRAMIDLLGKLKEPDRNGSAAR